MNDDPASTGARLEHLLTVQELSDYLGIPVATLYDWRVDHCGPKAVKLGHALRYPESAIRDGSRSGSMSRPVQPIGTFGTIAVKKVRERTFYASTRFRAYNGGYIRLSATGATDGAAQRELKRRLADYTEAQKEDGINSRSPLSDVAAIWLHEVSTAERLSPQTVDAYADNLRAVLLPDLGKMRLSELTVGVLDRYFKKLAVDHPSRARRGKIVLSQVMALAVRHDAIRANPVQMTGPIKKPLNAVKVLSIDELTHIRRIIAEWRTAGTVMGPKPDG